MRKEKLKKLNAFPLGWHMASLRDGKNLHHFNVIEDLNK